MLLLRFHMQDSSKDQTKKRNDRAIFLKPEFFLKMCITESFQEEHLFFFFTTQ